MGEGQKRMNFRMEREEYEHFEAVRAALQRRVHPSIKVTQKQTLLAAIALLAAHYEKLDRDRQRER